MEPTLASLWYLMGEGLALTYRAAPRFEARLTRHAALVLSGQPVADLNYVLLDQGVDAEERLRALHQAVTARRLPAIFIFSEQATAQVRQLADELGLVPVGTMPIMLCSPSSARAVSSEYRIERAVDERDLTEVCRIAAQAFNIPVEAVRRAWGPELLNGPGVDIFLARRGDEVVSTVQTTRAGNVAGVWAMATDPSYQRQGAGRHLLEAVMDFHLAHGCRHFYLGASPAGKPLYDRLGFKTVSEATIWVAGGEGDAAGPSH